MPPREWSKPEREAEGEREREGSWEREKERATEQAVGPNGMGVRWTGEELARMNPWGFSWISGTSASWKVILFPSHVWSPCSKIIESGSKRNQAVSKGWCSVVITNECRWETQEARPECLRFITSYISFLILHISELRLSEKKGLTQGHLAN